MTKRLVITIFLVFVLVLFSALSTSLFETNEGGEFQIKRAFITGNISVRDEPGTYGQWLGKIFTYKNVATIRFGVEEIGSGSADIESIDVIFNDGSKATNSGLVRIKLPPIGQRATLLNEYPGGYSHFIEAGVVPVVRNAVKLSANLRSAQDAYTTLALKTRCRRSSPVLPANLNRSADLDLHSIRLPCNKLPTITASSRTLRR